MCELINWSMVVSLPETTPIKKTDSLRSHQLSVASWLELGPSEHPPYFMMGLWLPSYCAGLVQATIIAMSSRVPLSWRFQKVLSYSGPSRLLALMIFLSPRVGVMFNVYLWMSSPPTLTLCPLIRCKFPC